MSSEAVAKEDQTQNKPNLKQHAGLKNIFISDNIKKNIVPHYPAKPGRSDMRTSGKKVITSIENFNFKIIPEKDTAQQGNNDYLSYPFRMNKQGKRCTEPVSLIKE